MTTYGQGQALAQSCTAPLPAPQGYRYWNTSTDGPIPSDLQAHAVSLANNMALPLGYLDHVSSTVGQTLLFQVEPHQWTLDASGNQVPGCYHAVGLYVPVNAPTPVTPPVTTRGGAGGALFLVAVGLGAVVSGITLWEKLR